MRFELQVPTVGESVTEAMIGKWLKQPGEAIRRDEPLVEIESEKATVEINAPADGVLAEIVKQTGEMATIGEVVGYMDDAAVPQAVASSAPAAASTAGNATAAPPKPAAAAPVAPAPTASEPRVMPAARRALAENHLTPAQVTPTGPGGRLLKEDVQRQVAQAPAAPPVPAKAPPAPVAKAAPAPAPVVSDGAQRGERVVPMTPIRRYIAGRLVEAQQTAALLTTFNEVDMTEVMELRKKYRDGFEQKHGVKLGFMSFFVKAVVEALRATPQVNAEVRGDAIVYHDYYDIGIAVGSGKGLVVPILRSAEHLGFAEIEKKIADFGARAAKNKIEMEELRGGTFTISNGGVYGSLLSTPIVNPPQSGILGLHAIQERPVAREGQVVIRPMMYVALTYDHRIVDGREAVTFLKHIKSLMEEPSRLLLEI
ncbi:MAG: 2-oxoglutarate dehydrogenase complex dihydrolipoyllysine-residue succinyltransferase [Pirellulales bacterium]|nr:2-oxoglutarate dehydrogenase complex dihydrolipoyllysine-residue succinyltransferase [Pirellulales bacterium]